MFHLQFPDPDIPEGNRVAVLLEHDRAVSVFFYFIFGDARGYCRALDAYIILDQHAIMKYGNSRGCKISGTILKDCHTPAFLLAFTRGAYCI